VQVVHQRNHEHAAVAPLRELTREAVLAYPGLAGRHGSHGRIPVERVTGGADDDEEGERALGWGEACEAPGSNRQGCRRGFIEGS
jgi:hypothetical protein